MLPSQAGAAPVTNEPLSPRCQRAWHRGSERFVMISVSQAPAPSRAPLQGFAVRRERDTRVLTAAVAALATSADALLVEARRTRDLELAGLAGALHRHAAQLRAAAQRRPEVAA